MVTPPLFILLVEDDPEIGRMVGDLLRQENYAVDHAVDARAMESLMRQRMPDLIVLDLMLPGEDGLSVLKRLRQTHTVPVLLLTAKSDEIDRVLGLELGADDYITKPFSPRELLARIRAILRRTKASGPLLVPSRRFGFEGYVIDLDARSLTDETGQPVALTSGEFDLLACFVQRPRRVLSRDQILDWTRGRTAEPFDRTVDMLISRLRRKLSAASPATPLITTVRNGGYLFTATVSQMA